MQDLNDEKIISCMIDEKVLKTIQIISDIFCEEKIQVVDAICCMSILSMSAMISSGLNADQISDFYSRMSKLCIKAANDTES